MDAIIINFTGKKTLDKAEYCTVEGADDLRRDLSEKRGREDDNFR